MEAARHLICENVVGAQEIMHQLLRTNGGGKLHYKSHSKEEVKLTIGGKFGHGRTPMRQVDPSAKGSATMLKERADPHHDWHLLRLDTSKFECEEHLRQMLVGMSYRIFRSWIEVVKYEGPRMELKPRSAPAVVVIRPMVEPHYPLLFARGWPRSSVESR